MDVRLVRIDCGKNSGTLVAFAVSNALKPQRRTAITGLTSSAQYIVRVEAHNIAGFATEEFVFNTLTKDGDTPPPDLITQQNESLPFYSDMKLVLPVVILMAILFVAGVTAVVCFRNSKCGI